MTSTVKSRIRMSSTCERDGDGNKYVPVIEVSFPRSNTTERYLVNGVSFFRESSAMMAASSHIRHMAGSGLAPWHMPDMFTKRGDHAHG